MGTKFKPLLRNDFSESERSKFSGMVTTVLRFLRPRVACNLRADRLVEFLGLNLVQMVKKFQIGILNFDTDFGKFRAAI